MTSLRPHFSKATLLICIYALLWGCGGNTTVRPTDDQQLATSSNQNSGEEAAKDKNSPRVNTEFTAGINAHWTGDEKKAESIFYAMSRAYPDLAAPHANLGMVLRLKGDKENAEKSFRRALEIEPNQPEVYNQLGIIYRENGEFDKAREAYEEGLKLSPDNKNLTINLGILYDLYLNQPNEAHDFFVRYKKLAPADEQIDLWIADVEQRLGDETQP